MSAGHRITEGKFVHNIEAGKASLRYEKHADLGRGVRGWKLNWSREGAPELSVNQLECVTCGCCSIVLDEHPHNHQAVVRLNLPELCSLIKMNLVAVYSPIKGENYENPCHFNVVLEDSISLDHFQAALQRIFQSPKSGG